MTDLSPQAQAIWDTYIGGYSKLLMTPVEQFDTSMDDDIKKILADVLRVFLNEVVPHEDEAPKSVFDCEPRPSYNFKTKKCDGPLHYDHGDYLRRQFRQDKLDICWEQRQQTRSMMLAIITKLEQI